MVVFAKSQPVDSKSNERVERRDEKIGQRKENRNDKTSTFHY